MNHTTTRNDNKRNWKIGDWYWGDAAATTTTSSTARTFPTNSSCAPSRSRFKRERDPPEPIPKQQDYAPPPVLARAPTTIVTNTATTASSNPTPKIEPSEDCDRNTIAATDRVVIDAIVGAIICYQ